MKLIAALAVVLALLLSFAPPGAPAHAEEGADGGTTLSDVLQALERYYEGEIAKPALDETVARYKAGGATDSSVDVDSVENPTLVHRRDFYDAYRAFDSLNCGNTDRPRLTSQMYFQGVVWQCNNGQWALVEKIPPLFLCEQFWERNRMYPQHTYVPPNCPPEPQPE